MIQIAALFLGLAGGQLDALDEFDYPSIEAVRLAWTNSEGTPLLRVSGGKDENALLVTAPFAAKPEMKRSVIDREVKLNLSVPAWFTLDVKPSAADAAGSVTLYFHSPGGWFGKSARLFGTEWQTLRYARAEFTTEENPAGWHEIDRIRIAVWRAENGGKDAAPAGVDAEVLLDNLTASWNRTALILPDSDGGESEAAQTTADVLEKMLNEFGAEVDRLPESSLRHGSLGRRRLALLPYNRPDEAACRSLAAFVEHGGKLFLGYHAPRPLRETLGFDGGSYFAPPEGSPRLAAMRFDAGDIPGLPKTVQQASWNISTVEPAGHGARVIAWWLDESGAETGKAAMLLSDRAAYLSHILLRDDWEEKKKMLAAILGKLEPGLWTEFVTSSLERAERIGHCHTGAELESAIRDHLTDETRRSLKEADDLNASARRLLAEGHGFEADQAARRCRELRAETYLASQPSPPREARAFWEHSGTGAYPGDWDRTCRELAEAGFNMVLPNMLWAGAAHYASDVLPPSKTFEKYGDQIEQCLAAAKKYGIEVHVWKVNYNPGHHSPKEFIDRMRREGRTQVDVNGEVTDWLNPAHPENFKLEVDSLLEVVRKYPVDGIHFDYIRYPGNQLDYSDFSRKQFEADSGLKVRNWPADCHSGPLHDSYRNWRAAQITRLVETVSREARKIRPGVKISAAVFRNYPNCREHVGQDWPMWAQRGYVDFLCPMDYTGDDREFAETVAAQKKLAGKVPLYPGIGATASRTTLTADRVAGQIHLARTLGADGFTVFNLSERTAATILPGIRAGAGRTPAVPPHRN